MGSGTYLCKSSLAFPINFALLHILHFSFSVRTRKWPRNGLRHGLQRRALLPSRGSTWNLYSPRLLADVHCPCRQQRWAAQTLQWLLPGLCGNPEKALKRAGRLYTSGRGRFLPQARSRNAERPTFQQLQCSQSMGSRAYLCQSSLAFPNKFRSVTHLHFSYSVRTRKWPRNGLSHGLQG
jgi:hypothetical protein